MHKEGVGDEHPKLIRRRHFVLLRASWGNDLVAKRIVDMCYPLPLKGAKKALGTKM